MVVILLTGLVVAAMIYLSRTEPLQFFTCTGASCQPKPTPATLPISERYPGVAGLLYVLIGIVDASVIAFIMVRARRRSAEAIAALTPPPPAAFATPPRPGSGPAAFPDMPPPVLAVGPPPPDLTRSAPIAVATVMVACAYCSYSLDPAARFCGRCGRPVAG